MAFANFQRFTHFFGHNSLHRFKTSLKKLLAVFACLLLVNAGMSCWQQVAAQSHLKHPQPATDMQSMNCHQAMALTDAQYTTGEYQATSPHHLDKNQTGEHTLNSTDTHAGSHDHCALNCSLYTLAAELAQQSVFKGNVLLVNKPADLTANPLQAWLRALERPPQRLS